MNFNVQETDISLTEIINDSSLPFYNARYLRDTPLDESLSTVPSSSVLEFSSGSWTAHPNFLSSHLRFVGYTGSTGFTGYTGFIGYMGPSGHSPVKGPTGYTGYSGYIGPTGANSSDLVGPTGPAGSTSFSPLTSSFVPSDPLVAKLNITSQSIISDSEITISNYTTEFTTSNFYVTLENSVIGLPFGLWKIVVNLQWENSSSGKREIFMKSSAPATLNNLIAHTTFTDSSSNDSFQQLTYIGSFGSQSVDTLPFFISANQDSGSPINVSGSVNIYSYSNEISTSPTGPPSPIEPGVREFALRFVNSDLAHPPQKIGIFYGQAVSGGGYVSVSSGVATQVNNPTPGTKVSSLFFDWTDLNIVDGNSNIREVILGSTGSVYNSSQIYIAKTDLTYDNGLETWLISPDGKQSPPISYYLSASADELTLDVVEFTYNWSAGNITNYEMTFNQTNVDAWSIPITISMLYKYINNARRMTNGPVGSILDSNEMLNDFKTSATGTVFYPGYVEVGGVGARLINTTHQSNSADINTYTNPYSTQFWNSWLSTPLTFYPGSTGPSSPWSRATLSTTGDISMVGSVATINGFGTDPVTFQILGSDIYDKGNDLYGNTGIWVTGTSTEQNIKAFLAAALTRGIAHLPGDFLGTHSYVAAIDSSDTNWNDYNDRGESFYNNIDPNIYGKIIHKNVLRGTINSFTLPYAYAIAYDDTFGYSSTITSEIINPPVSGSAPDTQCLRAEISIYTNNNLT
jgi:hypothetical protein